MREKLSITNFRSDGKIEKQIVIICCLFFVFSFFNGNAVSADAISNQSNTSNIVNDFDGGYSQNLQYPQKGVLQNEGVIRFAPLSVYQSSFFVNSSSYKIIDYQKNYEKAMKLERRLYVLQQYDIDFAIRILDAETLSGYDLFDYTLSAYRAFGLGKSSGDNKNKGILLVMLVSPEVKNGSAIRRDIDIQVMVGSGLEGDLNDGKIGRLLDQNLDTLKNAANREFDDRVLTFLNNVMYDLCFNISGVSGCNVNFTTNTSDSVGGTGGNTNGGGVYRSSYYLNDRELDDHNNNPSPPDYLPDKPSTGGCDVCGRFDEIATILSNAVLDMWSIYNLQYEDFNRVVSAIYDARSGMFQNNDHMITFLSNTVVNPLMSLSNSFEPIMSNVINPLMSLSNSFEPVLNGLFTGLNNNISGLSDLLEGILEAIEDIAIEITEEAGTNFWDFIGGLFGDVFELIEFLIEKVIYLVVPEDMEFLNNAIQGLSNSLQTKLEPVNILKNEITNFVDVEEKSFDDISVDLPIYGTVNVLHTEFLNQAVPKFRSLLSGAMILITSIWAYRKISSGLIT